MCIRDRKYITGDASDYEKFRAYVKCMPRLIGNPLYHWSHLELRRYFGYTGIICEKNCDEIWQLTSERLKKPYMSVRNIIKASNVDIICTTDDPADTLESHDRIASDRDFDVKVFPAFLSLIHIFLGIKVKNNLLTNEIGKRNGLSVFIV